MKWQLFNWLEGRFNPAVFRVWQKHIALQNFWVQQNLKPILTTGYFPPSCLSQFLKENLNPSVASYLHSTHQHVGEGNGTPLQYSCLENPMGGGAWWAAVHGVAKSRHDRAASLSLFTFLHWRRQWQPTPVFLPGESQGRGSLVGCRLWGHTESDTTEVT